ncbi:MAG: hypothetical protein ACRYG5_12730 [Janthinobacterium lividum]
MTAVVDDATGMITNERPFSGGERTPKCPSEGARERPFMADYGQVRRRCVCILERATWRITNARIANTVEASHKAHRERSILSIAPPAFVE